MHFLFYHHDTVNATYRIRIFLDVQNSLKIYLQRFSLFVYIAFQPFMTTLPGRKTHQLRAKSAKENIPLKQSLSHMSPEKPFIPSTATSTPKSPLITMSPTTNTSDSGSFSGFLAAPLETLRLSLDDPSAERITLHDLAETYNVISARLREAIVKLGLDSQKGVKALESIQASNSFLTKAMLRDINRLLIDPFSEDDSAMTDETKDDENMQYALDLSSVGHEAIRLLSQIMAFPAIHILFSGNHFHRTILMVSAWLTLRSEQQLGSLLGAAFDILQTPSLPTPHSSRTYDLLLWIMQTQQVPLNVLQPLRQDIMQVLQRAICRGYPKEQALLDGLKMLAHLLRTWPAEFWSPSQEFLPLVLNYLTSDSLDLRFQAAHAVSAFASAKLASPSTEENDLLSLSLTVKSFTEKSPKNKTTFLYILQRACGRTKTSHPAKGSQWAAVCICSLLILLDAYIFWCSVTIKVFLEGLYAIRKCSEDASEPTPLLHPVGWQCLVWAFSRLHPHSERISESAQQEDETRKRALRVVKQELQGSLGVVLVSQILEGTGADGNFRAEEALEIIEDMVDPTEDALLRPPLPNEGAALLKRLVSSLGCSSSTTEQAEEAPVVFTLAKELFNGSILDCKRDKLKLLLEPLNRVDLRLVRILTEDEIAREWEGLLSVWKKCVPFAMNTSTDDFIGNLSDIWQSLLLAKSRLDPDNTDLTPLPELVDTVSDIFRGILLLQVEPEAVPRKLAFLKTLWHTTALVFSGNSVQTPANAILAGLVSQGFHLSEEEVRSVWSALCGDIAHSLNRSSDDASERGIQGWMTVAPFWLEERDISLEDLMTFVKLPFPDRLQTEDQLSLWSRLCLRALDVSQSIVAREPFDWHVDNLLDRLTNGEVFRTQDTGKAFKIFRLVKDILPDLPHNVVDFLSTLENGLNRWLEDEGQIVPNDDYLANIIPLYQVALDKLSGEEPSPDTINTLERFFIAPFPRCPLPFPAQSLFRDFWTRRYRDCQHFVSEYSSYFIGCLRSIDCVNDHGSPLAVYLPQSVHSQEMESIVPETQLPNVNGSDAMNVQQYAFPPPEIAGGHVSESLSQQPIGLSHEAQVVDESYDGVSSADSTTSSRKRKRTVIDCVEIVSKRGVSRKYPVSHVPRRPVQNHESQLMTPEPSGHSASSPPRPASDMMGFEDEDYGSWEEVVSLEQLQELKQEMEHSSSSRRVFNGPSFRPEKRRKVDIRSPAADHSSAAVSSSVHYTSSPGSSSDRLRGLRDAYHAFAKDQEIPAEELLQANKVLQHFVSVVNQKLAKHHNQSSLQ
ncbi:hypothetical protein D9758_014451 [Tetrapyrgos nigripes]|uniref:Telomere-associated protein Rif1 N-terminal domain-containing protein n=1 Tax=Tetrapyrgos nigripes TaxID=182062 RepID=A0A8H5FB20_9AGAR|nr:hypothetical protein D9758_014451 [Tetrapyrgos nigripes]